MWKNYTLIYTSRSLSHDDHNIWEATDLLIDFGKIIATEVEISQFDEINESAIIHRLDVIVGQPDLFQIGEPSKSADYNMRQFVSI